MREGQEAGERGRQPTGPPELYTPETTASEDAEEQPEDEKPKRGVWLPHPDDEFPKTLSSKILPRTARSSSRAEKISTHPITRPE